MNLIVILLLSVLSIYLLACLIIRTYFQFKYEFIMSIKGMYDGNEK